jgi:bifunctional UDP-N-acetylglucosamine pyrophosphorylase/glucosamine-1-phosphate N-acetyltransferase
MAVPTAWLHKYLPNLNNNNVQKEYYLTDLIKMVVDEGNPVDTLFPRYGWEVTGVNDRLQQADLEREYQKHQAQNLMRLGVSLKDPSRFDLRGSLECDQDVEIDVNCIFEGKVKLGLNVKIGAYCFIRNAEIAANTCIEPYSHIDGAKIGENGKIGPFSRLRPGTVLAEHVHIGNFVELKNSQIEAYSKANHLSYLGDAHIGKRVNIGAGTITCNYDGVNKHKTVIEDDVFIGSSTQLVAPLILKKGVTVAAGTTIWKDVHDENALVLNIKEQRSRLSWLRPCKSEGK